MSMDGRVRRRFFIEGEAYIETEHTHGPRGMGESSTVSFDIRKSDRIDDAVEVKIAGIDDPVHVPLQVLQAAVKIARAK